MPLRSEISAMHLPLKTMPSLSYTLSNTTASRRPFTRESSVFDLLLIEETVNPLSVARESRPFHADCSGDSPVVVMDRAS